VVEASEKLWSPHYLDNLLTGRGKVVALRTGRALLPRNISFLLEAEQTPGPSAAGRIR
jgi:hypothetical protein